MDVGMMRWVPLAGADQRAGCGQREGGFAKSTAAGEQPGMMHPLPAERLAPFAPGGLVTEQHQEAVPKCRLTAPRTRWWTSSTVPLPSTIAKRPGSLRANSRKAALTDA